MAQNCPKRQALVACLQECVVGLLPDLRSHQSGSHGGSGHDLGEHVVSASWLQAEVQSLHADGQINLQTRSSKYGRVRSPTPTSAGTPHNTVMSCWSRASLLCIAPPQHLQAPITIRSCPVGQGPACRALSHPNICSNPSQHGHVLVVNGLAYGALPDRQPHS